jgi:uncharacterized protein
MKRLATRVPVLVLILATALLLTAGSGGAFADEPQAKEAAPAPKAAPAVDKARHEAILKLMKASGAADLGMQVMDQLLPALKQLADGVPDEFWKKFMTKVNVDLLIEMAVPIYAKYLDDGDIKALTAFYESPVGKKLIKVQPFILRDSMTIGEAWGRRIGEEAIKELKDAGYQVKI